MFVTFGRCVRLRRWNRQPTIHTMGIIQVVFFPRAKHSYLVARMRLLDATSNYEYDAHSHILDIFGSLFPVNDCVF